MAVGAAGVDKAAPAPEAARRDPPAAAAVDFGRDIRPIFQASCVQCHARGKAKGKFSLETRAHLLKGGENGPVVVPGKSGEGSLFPLVESTDPDARMPQKGKPLTPREVGLLRAWIDQGAAWPDSISFAARVVPLEPRKVALPAAKAGSNLTNPIDLLLQPYFDQHPTPAAGRTVDDRAFARRAHLDVIGLLPAPDDLAAFAADASSDKRAALVRKLLADHRRYAEHWMTFWNDALRNDYKGTGYVDGGRAQITDWLFKSLRANLPYDQFVRQLVTGAPGAEGFSKGIVWRGVVNASQTPQMQAAQNISQVFLGVNLKCASCHDSFINDWKLTDAYGMAAVYADKPLEIAQCDRPLGKTAEVRFLYPQLGTIDAAKPRQARVQQLAEILTSEKNGRLARTIVNRLWKNLMGRGIVEPVDEMDNDPWSADVLDYLAADLAEHKYDLKRTIELILTSRAYQMPAVGAAQAEAEPFVFAGPVVRRLTAEQFADAVGTITTHWPAKPAAKVEMADANGAVRQVLCTATPLTAAMGRPNRDQVMTGRPTIATTLEALELTNGGTLATALKEGAAKLLAGHKGADPAALIDRIYARALARGPTPGERAAALEVVGQPATAEGVEDLLWAVMMLPEFQLVR